MLKHKGFNHTHIWYHYRTHSKRVDELKQNKLKDYLNSLFLSCPDSYFNSGPRSSSLNFKLPHKIYSLKGHELSLFTKQALEEDLDLSAHTKIQLFLLNHDKKTLAVEIPIWIEQNELKNFKEIFNSELPLTGHIDLLRLEDGKIWVWDYKPNAKNERFASTQVYFYALMLSKRTGIPLSNFNCGYFDHNYAFIFKPEENEIPINKKLQ